MIRPTFLCACWCIAVLPFSPPSNAAAYSESCLLSHADDYVFGYYPYGWRNRDENGDIVFAIQTNSYAVVLNASKARIERAGATARHDAEIASQQGNDAVLTPLPSAPLTFQVRIGDEVYDAVAGAPKPDAVLIQRLGKYLVNVEVRGITLKARDGSTPDGLTAKLLLYAWPDHIRVVMQVDLERDMADVALVARYAAPTGRKTLHAVSLNPDTQTERIGARDTVVEGRTGSIGPGSAGTVCIGLYPRFAPEPTANGCIVRAEGIAPYAGALPVSRDVEAGWYLISLGDNPDIWTMERVRLELENPNDSPQTVRLSFAKRGGGYGITGMSPVLCDESGMPLGLPVQISKNWHSQPPWFDGITVLELAPHAKHSLEFRLAYAEWGGMPAVSHAQLALEGWGTHQLWDECAIGSFGESITYDPDVNLNRSMIDDVRPLMVWGMGKEPQKKWSWTHNVGGGDFLVLEQDGKRQYLARQKTEYESQGPVLTTVRYSGETPDGAIQSHITTQSWRSDDFVRGLYTIRYDVVKPVTLSRLALFQLGADHYNQNIFTHISRGNLEGKQETWEPVKGGKRYSREGMPLEGENPWLAITGNTKNPPPAVKEGDQGAWADRGMIVHRWQARLGGAVVPLPHYSIFGTEDGSVPSAIIELAPPPGVTRLQPNDFVDAQVEMVILPQRAEDYYGPNESFRAALREHGGSWEMVQREAAGTALEVCADIGKLVSVWPIAVHAHRGTSASLTIVGANGIVPITITGVKRNGPFMLNETRNGQTRRIEQSGVNDWWQTRYIPSTKSYDLTFTLPFDGDGSDRTPVTLTWTAGKPATP